MNGPRIFISYAREDESAAKRIYEDLLKAGFVPWIDFESMKPGENWKIAIKKAIEDSEYFIVLLSSHSVSKTGYVQKELLTAIEFLELRPPNTVYLMPVRLEKCEPSHGKLLELHWVDMYPNWETGLLRIIAALSEGGDKYAYKQKSLLCEKHGVPEKPKPNLAQNPFNAIKEEEGEPVLGEISTAFFHKRFCSAFPGIRGVEWFTDPKEAISRLNLLLKQPLIFRDGRPIWWWRDGDLHIEEFRQLDDTTVLMDGQEFIVDKVAAVNAGSYYQSFVYLQTNRSEPTGLYHYSSKEEWTREHGYYREEFGIYEGHLITREEYDDNAAVINGEVVELKGQTEIRVRYLTPYNLIIAPIDSPINNKGYDRRRWELMNKVLREEEGFETLVKEIMLLLKRSKY